MMIAIRTHYTLNYTKVGIDFASAGSIGSHIQKDQIVDFLKCHHSGHAHCSKSLANMNCWTAVVFAATLAYFNRRTGNDPQLREALLTRWPSSPFYAAIRAAFSKTASWDEEHAALRFFFTPFIAPGVTHLNFYNHPVSVLRDHRTNGKLVKPHNFGVDSVLALDVHWLEETHDDKRALWEFAPGAAMLASMEHLAVVVSPNAADALATTVMGLESTSVLRPLPLKDFVYWSGTEPGVLGRVVELHMDPDRLERFQTTGH
jgi:hypothetical protein